MRSAPARVPPTAPRCTCSSTTSPREPNPGFVISATSSTPWTSTSPQTVPCSSDTTATSRSNDGSIVDETRARRRRPPRRQTGDGEGDGTSPTSLEPTRLRTSSAEPRGSRRGGWLVPTVRLSRGAARVVPARVVPPRWPHRRCTPRRSPATCPRPRPGGPAAAF